MVCQTVDETDDVGCEVSDFLRAHVVHGIGRTKYASMGMWRDSLRKIPPIGFSLPRSEGLDHAGGVHRLHDYVRWSVSEEYAHDGLGVCLGDGQTEAYLKDMGMSGLASAWAMARRRPI